MWHSSTEPKAQPIDRRVISTRNALKKFDVAPSRDWHRTNRVRARGQGMQQPNMQNGVQTSMLLENQRRAAAATDGSRARARRLGIQPAWDSLRNQGTEQNSGWTRSRCIREWLNNPHIQQRPEDHVCWQFADRSGTMQGQIERRMQRRENYAERQANESEEFMAENPDAGDPTEDDSAPMGKSQPGLTRQVDRRLNRREQQAAARQEMTAAYMEQEAEREAAQEARNSP